MIESLEGGERVYIKPNLFLQTFRLKDPKSWKCYPGVNGWKASFHTHENFMLALILYSTTDKEKKKEKKSWILDVMV